MAWAVILGCFVGRDRRFWAVFGVLGIYLGHEGFARDLLGHLAGGLLKVCQKCVIGGFVVSLWFIRVYGDLWLLDFARGLLEFCQIPVLLIC